MEAWRVPALVRGLINKYVLHIVQTIALPEDEYKATTWLCRSLTYSLGEMVTEFGILT